MNDTLKQRRQRRPRNVDANGTNGQTAVSELALIEGVIRRQGQQPRYETTPIEGEGGGLTEGGSVTARAPGMEIMYKPSADGWRAYDHIPAGAVNQNLLNGWRLLCPDCNNHHKDKEGRITKDPNACSAREKLAVRQCQVCGKRIYDNRGFGNIELDDDVIQDDAYAASTPALRTKAQLDLHIWTFHPATARAMAITPPPQAPAEVLDAIAQRTVG